MRAILFKILLIIGLPTAILANDTSIFQYRKTNELETSGRIEHLNINASTNTYTSNENTKDLSGSVKFTMYGGGGGSAGLNYTQGYFNIDNLIHNNSLLYAKNNLNINTSNDTTIQGANLRADNIANIKVGNNLSLISQRDSYSSTHKSTNIGAGIGISGEKSQSNNPNPYAISNNMINYDNSKLSNINSNFSQSNSNTITKQTNLSSITANELNINTKNNTHLKGSLIAAGYYKDNTKNSNNNLVFIDNKNLNLTTNTLTYENLSNTSYTKDSSLSVGLNYAIKESIVAKENKANDTKQSNQIDNQANTTTKQTNQDINSKISSLNYSNNRNLSYNHSKTLATIGQGNLIVANTNISNLNKDELENLQSTNTNLSNSDNLTRLNRDTTKTNKDLYNTSISSNVDATIDARFFTQKGREEIAKEYKDMDKNMAIISDTLPDENSENPAEAIFGYTWNKIGFLSLGILPTNANNGGFLGNIPGYFGYEDSKFEVIKDNKDNKQVKNIYINGIMNTKKDAQNGAKNIIGDINFEVWYNPTRGLLADSLEFLVDKFYGKTGISKQISQKQNEKDKNGNHIKRDIFMHSQAHEITKYGVNLNNRYFSFGAPMRDKTLTEIYGKPNEKGKIFLYIRKNDGDYVSYPENIFIPKTWFMPGHSTKNYNDQNYKNYLKDNR